MNQLLRSVRERPQSVTDQIPNVERIATYMKNNPKSTVSIKGYASPEGKAEVNARVAKQRAEAVKNMLIKVSIKLVLHVSQLKVRV